MPCVIDEWDKLNPEIRNSGSYNIFRSVTIGLTDTIGIKLITRLRLGFSHLPEHKFSHNFQDTLNPLCSCSIEAESTSHYLMCCHFFDTLRPTLISDLRNIDSNLPTFRDENLTNILLYGNQIYDDKTNQIILMHVIGFRYGGL